MPACPVPLITAAAFMPVGFSQSTTGEYAGGIFWIVGVAVVFSWLCSGLFTSTLPSRCLPAQLGHPAWRGNL